MVQINGMDMKYKATHVAPAATFKTLTIEAYFHQIQRVLNSTLIEISELLKSHGA